VWIALGADDAAERVAADTGLDTGAAVAPGPAGLLWSLRRTPGDAPAEWVRIHQASRSPARRDSYRVRIQAGDTTFGSIWAVRDRSAGNPDRPSTRMLSAAADQIGQALAQDGLAGASRAAEIARQSDAMKSSLLQSVSHDLRTPLAAIRVAAAGLRPDSGLDDAARVASADGIELEVERLNRLVTNLLDVSRIEAGSLRVEREAMALDDVLARAIQRLEPQLHGRSLQIALDAPPVEVDPVLLDAAFTNVAENALAHAGRAAPIRIRSGRTDDGFIRLTVEDGGAGVPDSALPLLFDKFYRVAGGAGTGIGLAVTRGFVEAMGGHVAARRSELGGLAIDLDLPAAALPPELAS
ncbi:MAG TPA: ATP-binding protein, partial [Candidatus Limnocylindrales bacterium]